MMALSPVSLEAKHIRLVPLGPEHAAGLLRAGAAPEIWDWMSARLNNATAVDAWVSEALAAQERGNELPFTVVRVADDRILGSTRYMDIQAAHRGLEIGWTWYAPEAWATEVNPEAKYLLLRHAFESWGALRVQLKTDARNLRSQAAIRKLGARYEGRLRNHRIRPDGTVRDSMMFSIIESEWPAVKAALEHRLGRGPG